MKEVLWREQLQEEDEFESLLEGTLDFSGEWLLVLDLYLPSCHKAVQRSGNVSFLWEVFSNSS